MRKTVSNVDIYSVSTYQCSILFNNMGSFNRKSEFPKAENHVTELSPLGEFLGNNHAHVILTAEADSLPIDEKKLLEDCGVVGCHSSKSNDLSVHASTVVCNRNAMGRT